MNCIPSPGHVDAGLCRAAKAASSGLFEAEIVPVTTTMEDAGGQVKTVTVNEETQAYFTVVNIPLMWLYCRPSTPSVCVHSAPPFMRLGYFQLVS